MKKNLITVMIAILLAISSIFVSCSGTKPNSSTKKYTVTFVYNDEATANYSVRIAEGSKVSNQQTPEREGYVFDGWYIDSALTEKYDFENPVTKNFLLYAKWSNECTVTFVYNNEGLIDSSVKIAAGGKLTKPADPTLDGYTFDGWFTDTKFKNAYDFSSVVESNLTLYAKLTPNNSVVTYVFNDGATADKTESYKTGTAATKPESPTRTGYSFGGWYTDKDLTEEYDFTSPLSGNVTLYAAWLEEGVTYYTVVIHYNDSTGRTSSVKVKNNARATKPQDPEDDDCVFMGWYSDAEFKNGFMFSTRITANTDIYAKWGSSYIFEAEDTIIKNIVGKGYSGTATGSDIIGKHASASNGYYITYLYDKGITLEFCIISDKDVDDARLYLSLSAELANFTINGDNYQVLVNDTALPYEIVFDDVDTSQTADTKPFEFYEISLGVSLKKGENVIKLVTNNSTPLMGTMNATAPMVDCVKIVTDATLGWDTSKGYPVDNTSQLG